MYACQDNALWIRLNVYSGHRLSFSLICCFWCIALDYVAVVLRGKTIVFLEAYALFSEFCICTNEETKTLAYQSQCYDDSF